MPAYSFKQRFAWAIEAGLKRSTIRPVRKRPTRPGETLYLYTGQRTACCRKLATVTCVNVRSIMIDGEGIMLDGQRIPQQLAEQIAHKDGFTAFTDFLAFFDDQYGLPTPLMTLIEW